MHENSLAVFRRYGQPLLQIGHRVLEIGPDWSIPGGRVKPLIAECGCLYEFADIKNHPQGVGMLDEYTLECGSCEYDAVVSLSVAEHVRKVWTWLKELTRVTAEGGLVIVVNPISWPYHESPYDCWRIYPEGWKALFEEVGLKHVFSWHGSVTPIEPYLKAEHGPQPVVDAIAIGRKPRR